MTRCAARAILPLAGLCLLVASGCSAAPGLIRRDSAAGLYDRASIQYELDASRLSLPLAITHVEGRFVSYEHVPSHPAPGKTLGKLTIEYPHPAGHTELALARVEILSQLPSQGIPEPPATGWTAVVNRAKQTITGPLDSQNTLRESWELAIRKSELDDLVARLNRSGYFDRRAHRHPGVRLSSTIDGSKMTKNWEQTAELDALMLRVRNHGQLVAYHRPPGFNGDKQPASSVVAYRELQAGRAAHSPATSDDAQWMAGRHGLAAPAADTSRLTRLPQVDANTGRY